VQSPARTPATSSRCQASARNWAERLALELSDKVAQFAFERQVERLAAATRARAIDLDALTEGLVQLGYTRRDAQAALNAILDEQPDADEQTLMRLALARLAPRR
jgi:Holliday junction DNA helicase RuvA